MKLIDAGRQKMYSVTSEILLEEESAPMFPFPVSSICKTKLRLGSGVPMLKF